MTMCWRNLEVIDAQLSLTFWKSGRKTHKPQHLSSASGQWNLNPEYFVNDKKSIIFVQNHSSIKIDASDIKCYCHCSGMCLSFACIKISSIWTPSYEHFCVWILWIYKKCLQVDQDEAYRINSEVINSRSYIACDHCCGPGSRKKTAAKSWYQSLIDVDWSGPFSSSHKNAEQAVDSRALDAFKTYWDVRELSIRKLI